MKPPITITIALIMTVVLALFTSGGTELSMPTSDEPVASQIHDLNLEVTRPNFFVEKTGPSFPDNDTGFYASTGIVSSRDNEPVVKETDSRKEYGKPSQNMDGLAIDTYGNWKEMAPGLYGCLRDARIGCLRAV